MFCSESELDFSFAINSVLDFVSASESDTECQSECSSVLMNLDICIFFTLYLDNFFADFHNRINSYASNASLMYIFFWHTITQKVCFYHLIKFSYFSF